jgi:hypothetical protein
MNPRNILKYAQLLLGIRPDDTLGFRLLAMAAKRWVPDYKLTWPELAWFKNSVLLDILRNFDELDGFNAHRRLALQQLLRLTSHVEGDTAECGVYKGCGSYIILAANERSSSDRIHHVFDSFEGLSRPDEKDGDYWTAHDLTAEEALAKRKLIMFERVRFYKGWIPSRFTEIGEHKFSFVHVDVDLYEPTLKSIEFFYDKINTGGIFVCDDYGFLTCPGATSAIDEFLLSRKEKMVSLPGGGGFFIKGCTTAPE